MYVSRIREFLDISSEIVVTPQDASYIIKAAGTDTITVEMTMKKAVLGLFVNDGVTLQFVDGGGGDDSLVRDKGSWIDDQFGVGMTLTISGTTSNNGSSYVITSISDDGTTLYFATATVTAEADVTGATITGNISAGDWMLVETVVGTDKFNYIEGCGTGLKFTKTAGGGVSNVWVQS